MLSKICEEFPVELIQQRKIMGLSQEDLGKLAGLSKKSIQRYETCCYSKASLEVLTKIARALEKYRESLVEE